MVRSHGPIITSCRYLSGRHVTITSAKALVALHKQQDAKPMKVWHAEPRSLLLCTCNRRPSVENLQGATHPMGGSSAGCCTLDAQSVESHPSDSRRRVTKGSGEGTISLRLDLILSDRPAAPVVAPPASAPAHIYRSLSICPFRLPECSCTKSRCPQKM